MSWKLQFESLNNHINVAGFIAASEEDCRQFFVNRVLTKLVESSGAEELRQHLIELDASGFELNGFLNQIEEPPKAKDWEIGEAFAEIALEDSHEAMFPWPTALDKRVESASLPGPDLVGLHRSYEPRFVFGQVKTSSEVRVPPQVVNSTSDCLRHQMYQLRHSAASRQQLISWLLAKARDTPWETTFNEALQKYSEGDFWLVGMLVSGKRDVNANDLVRICADIEHTPDQGEIHLLGFYLPFHKDEWVDIVYGGGTTP